MADPAGYPDAGEDTAGGRDAGSAAGAPRWVKVTAIVVLVLIVLVVVMLLVGGDHGPGRH